jgi:hypothetical protein
MRSTFVRICAQKVERFGGHRVTGVDEAILVSPITEHSIRQLGDALVALDGSSAARDP